MKIQGNPTLDKRTKPWTVQRIRTKQGHVHITGKRINSGSHGVPSHKRRAYRKYANRVTYHLNYTRAMSCVGF